MNILFDKNKKPIIPQLFLLNPDEEVICAVSGASNIKSTICFNKTSTLTFDIYEYDNNIKNPCYDLIKRKKLIDTGESFGKFIITNVIRSSSGETIENTNPQSGFSKKDIIYKKSVTCYSLEYEFSYKPYTAEGTRKFYSPEDNSGLLNELVSQLPSWSIGFVSTSLWNVYRTFNNISNNIYNFMMGDVEEKYGVIFDFDTVNRKVNAYDNADAVRQTDIFISFNNLMSTLEVQDAETPLVTALNVQGADGVYINAVNPLGGSVIYNFTPENFVNSEWMSLDLIEAVVNWNKKVKRQQTKYSNLLLTYKNYLAQLTGYETELTELEGELKALEQQRWARIETSQSISSVTSQVSAKQTQINNKNAQIKTVNAQIDSIIVQLNSIVKDLDLKNTSNFTTSQLLKLSSFIHVGEYVDNSFQYTDGMSIEEKHDIAQELYDKGREELDKLSLPSYIFTANILNFLFLKEYEVFTKQLQLGCSIAVEVKQGEVVYPILLGIELDYDNPTNSTFTFGNSYRLKDAEWTIQELFNQAHGTAANVSVKGSAWNSGAETKDEFNNYISNALNLANQAITTSSEQLFTMDEVGIRGKKNGSTKEIWINNNLIAMTRDGWQTSSLAIGETTLPSGGVGYGIVAQSIVGNLIAGNQLFISNSSGSFKVDGDGMTATNFDLTMTSGNNTIKMSPKAGITATIGGSTKFKLDITTGSAQFMGDITGSTGTFSGSITANKGSIGGWSIEPYGLISSYGDYINSNGNIRLGIMTITPTSVSFSNMLTMSSSSAIFNGNIYAKNLLDKVKDSQIENLEVNKLTANYGKISNLNSIAATIGGWTLANNRLYASSGSTYCGMSADMQWDTRFYAGATNSAGANATWFVTQKGTMVANNAQIKGTITSSNISGNTIRGGTISGSTISGSTINGGTLNIGGIKISSDRTGDIRWNGSASCYINMADSVMSIFHGSQINIATVGTGGVHIGGRCYLPSYTYLSGKQMKSYQSGSRMILYYDA